MNDKSAGWFIPARTALTALAINVLIIFLLGNQDIKNLLKAHEEKITKVENRVTKMEDTVLIRTIAGVIRIYMGG